MRVYEGAWIGRREDQDVCLVPAPFVELRHLADGEEDGPYVVEFVGLGSRGVVNA